MKNNRRLAIRITMLVLLATASTSISSRYHADSGTCGGQMITLPFTDVSSSTFFCEIAEAFICGLSNGASSTIYGPSDPVNREEAAAIITRTQDSALRRGSSRAALRQFWMTTPRYLSVLGGLGTTIVGEGPNLVESDGTDLWVANVGSTISRVRASDGKMLETWTRATFACAVLVAMGRVFVTGETSPGNLYMIDPRSPAGKVTRVINGGLGDAPVGIAFDGSRIWTANVGRLPAEGSVSIITPTMNAPWSVTNVTAGFSAPNGILFDGSNVWVTNILSGSLLKLDEKGGVILSVAVGNAPAYPAFDGTNIWVPNFNSDSVSVVRAATGVVIATLKGNGLSSPRQAAFDGQRTLVTNTSGNSVSLWNAADLRPIGTVSTGTGTAPVGVCSDGTYFWITLFSTSQLARY